MIDAHYLAEQLAEAARLRAAAEADEVRARRYDEELATLAEHYRRRAEHQRWLASNRDGGLRQ